MELAEEAPADSAAAAPAEPAAIVPVEGGIQIGQAYAAAHGTKCFTEAVAVVKDDVILAAYLDDFQFTSTDGVTAVPNSDSDFAAGYAEGKVLMSKRANADYYSKMMAEKGGSTVALDANFDAIQNFAVGKTISELEDVAAKGAEAVDAVSGATLVDTAGYLCHRGCRQKRPDHAGRGVQRQLRGPEAECGLWGRTRHQVLHLRRCRHRRGHHRAELH